MATNKIIYDTVINPFGNTTEFILNTSFYNPLITWALCKVCKFIVCAYNS